MFSPETKRDLGATEEKRREGRRGAACGGRMRGIAGGERRDETLDSERDSDPALRQAIFFLSNGEMKGRGEGFLSVRGLGVGFLFFVVEHDC